MWAFSEGGKIIFWIWIYKFTNGILEYLLKTACNTSIICGQHTVDSNQWRNYRRDCTGAQTPQRAHLGFNLTPTTLLRASLSQQVSKGVLPQEWVSETLRLAMAHILPAALYASSIHTYCRNCVCPCVYHDYVTLMTPMTSFIIIWFVYYSLSCAVQQR